MGTFKSSRLFDAPPALIEQIVADVENTFINKEFTVEKDELLSGGYDISLTKGNIFKAVLGMKSALKVLVRPQNNGIYIEAGVGIFGQQAIPSAITLFIAWPVLVTQIWGLVKQSKLDDVVMQVAQETINNASGETKNTAPSHESFKYCPECGTKVSASAKFCGECGEKLV